MDGVVRVGVATNDIFEAEDKALRHALRGSAKPGTHGLAGSEGAREVCALGLVVGSAPWHQALRGAPCAFSVVGRAGS